MRKLRFRNFQGDRKNRFIEVQVSCWIYTSFANSTRSYINNYFFLTFSWHVLPSSAVNGFDPPHKAVIQTYLDPVGMCDGFRQNIPDDAFGELSGSLILL